MSMVDDHDVPPSVLDQLQGFAWSSAQSVDYEAALEAINGAVGAFTARVRAEEQSEHPDLELLARLREGRAECAAARRQLDPREAEQIQHTRDHFAALTERLRSGGTEW